MKIIAYIRVSSTAKADHEESAAEQRRKCRAWAAEHGHVIAATFADEGISGENGLADRTGLPEALHMLKDGGAGGLVVSKLDRLSRDMVLQEQLFGELRRLGAEPFSCSPSEQAFLGDDPDDPSRAMIRRILGAVNQYERDMIALRLRGGKRAKRARGGYAGGFVPLGQRVEGREFVPDQAGQAAIARIRELHAGGRSLREIIAALDAEGHRTKQGGRWHPSTVSRLLARTEGRQS
jgi:DNA invertase Pin-like site-specific DNA recombinase